MNTLETLRNKILTPDKIEEFLTTARLKNLSIVFTNGCFDILHRGHVEYLSKAADLGDILFIGLNSDVSVKNIKGPNRPVQDEEARSTILAALGFVSAISLFNEDTPYNLIKKVQPDFLTKGADYNPEEIVGYDIVTGRGGKVITIDLTEGHSTTGIIKRMKE